jgi:hypothetical protein
MVALWVVIVAGWIANLVKLIGMIGHADLLTLLPVLRIVGLFVAPLGVVLGFIPN